MGKNRGINKKRTYDESGNLRCSTCDLFKSLDLFCKSKRDKDGVTLCCLQCKSNRARERYEDPVIRERRLAQNRETYRKNHKTWKRATLRWYQESEENKLKHREMIKKYYRSEKGKETIHKKQNRYTELMTDLYIKQLFCRRGGLVHADITPEMIETLRLHLTLKRALRKINVKTK